MTRFKSISAQGRLLKGNEVHTVNTPLFIFQDEGNWFYFSPALDLTGYGKTEEEAEDSYRLSLEELLKYTINKGTINKVLVDLGWHYTKISKKRKNLEAPSLHEMIYRDDYLKEIFNTKEYKKVNESVNLPLETVS